MENVAQFASSTVFSLAALNWNWELDGWIVAVAILCSVACSLLGNFLVLRKMSMLGDAITHAVLPGLAIAFFVSHSRNGWPMFVGAVIVGILTAFFSEWIRRVGNVDEGASMGVVFTSLFALGLVMIVQTADTVDLDPGCVLYGAIEFTPLDRIAVFGWVVPRAFVTLSVVLLVNLAFVILFFKELRISSFDAGLATSSGFNATLLHYAQMVLVAVTAVACFESVGSVLVVAMLVVPGATAYLLTDRLSTMIWLSSIIAVLAAVGGHLSAILVPSWFGFESTTTAGMMAVCSGCLLMLAALFAPGQGIVIRFVRQRLLSLQILEDDIVALLFKREEREESQTTSEADMLHWLLTNKWSQGIALRRLVRKQQISRANGAASLTELGKLRAKAVVRSHRLWEQYLQEHAGLDKDRLHAKAEQFEHFTDQQLRNQLDQQMEAPTTDPHGSPIPAEDRDNPAS